MIKIRSNLYMIDSIDDASKVAEISNNYDLLIISPGMLDDDISDTEFAEVADAILKKNDKLFVILLHNQSHGIISDFFESLVGKIFGILGCCPEYPARVLRNILDARNSYKSTYIISHSQGGIITTNAVNSSQNYNLKDNIRLYYFGSANWLLPYEVDKTRIQTFTNQCDLVSCTFGRGLLKNTIRLKDIGHYVKDYQKSMIKVFLQ